MSLHHDDGDDNEAQYIHDYPQRNSIDLTLELERQLDSESLPTSPADPRFAIHPDPSVLESLVTQLRNALAKVEKERDELRGRLEETQARAINLEDAFNTASQKCVQLEEDLTTAVLKGQEDKDAVVMLRGKLEDSRKALMRLQTESRRKSQIADLTLDLSRSGPSSMNGPPSSRRSSFVPLTGSPAGWANAHRRIVSVSEPGSYLRDTSSPPGTAALEHLQLGGGPSSAVSAGSRRRSGFFGRVSPTPDLSPMPDASEVEELKKELQTTKEQLEETRHELTEAREAQEASDTCVRALRTFISENSIGMQPPGGRVAQSASPASNSGHAPSMSRWSFKLWNTPPSTSTPNSSPALSSASAQGAAASAPVPPITRKLGGFFSSRTGSISSASSMSRPEPHSHQQEPICNGSDSSSVDSGTEPVSPSSELPVSSIAVRDANSPSSYPLTDSPEQHSKVLSSVDLSHRLESANLE